MSKLLGGRERPRAPGPPACPEWAKVLFFTGDAPAEDSPDHAAYVETFFEKGSLEQLWATHRSALLREWVRPRPGTRPPRWWDEAPEMRRFLPGQAVRSSGTQYFQGGVPCAFPDNDDPDDLVFEGKVKVESQATYLRRLQLFLPGEAGRVKRARFKPESFDFTVPDEEGGIAPGGPRVDSTTAYARAVLKDGGDDAA